MILELFLKKLKEIESQLIMLIKLKVNVLSLIDGLMFVLIVKTDIKLVLLSNLYMILKWLKEKLLLILLILEKVLTQIQTIIKKGTDENKSIYQIKIENKDNINKSITTLYRYVNNGYLTTKRIDLPYAVTYKKRKHNKKYEYSENNKIDRTGHTYLDYLAFMHKNPGIYVWQLDFLGTIKSDSKNILSFILPNVHFTLLDIINNPNSKKVVEFFDNLENVILTDRDPCFNDIEGICFSKITGEERCKLFFCDSYVYNQKPHVENINKQIKFIFICYQ